MLRIALYIIILCFSLIGPATVAQTKVEIFADIQGNDTLQKLLDVFVLQLKKSTAVNFTVQPVKFFKGKGIYIGNTNFTAQLVKPAVKLLHSGIEAFSVDADGNSVKILGNSNMALGHGIFSYLDFIGYRFYFANPDWHILPDNPNLFPRWHIVSKPAFAHRRIWYGYGTGSKIADDHYNFWVLANRNGGSMNAYFGHAYEEIAFRNLDSFAKHPEWAYPSLPNGKLPYDIKFDMSREDLVQFVIRDVERRIESSIKNKTADYKMISLGPSDGPGTCNTPECQKLGTITDRVYYLVNRVAKAVRKKYPSTVIGCLAYGEYSPPPTKNVEPNVFTGITTAFNASKYSVDQLVDEWRKKGSIVGIYDYFSWYAWDFDVPGQSLASRTDDIVKSIKKFYDKGVKAYEGESSIGWVSKGLGYYLASKYMWDIKTDGEALKKEFFRRCFGKAEEPMKKLWKNWESYSFSTVRDNDLASWIDYVSEAEKLEQDDAVRKRFLQIKSYLHYLFLYKLYMAEKTEPNLLTLLSYGYRKLDDGSVSGYPAFWELGNRSGFKDMGYVENAKWKTNGSPVSAAEINQLLANDRKRLVVTEKVKEYPSVQQFTNVPDIKKYGNLFADSSRADNAFWMTNEWVVQVKSKSPANYIDFTGDYIADPTVLRPIKIFIYAYTASGNVSGLQPLVYYEYKTTKEKERISLSQLAPGYYTMIIEDPVKVFRFSCSPSLNYSAVMRPGKDINCTALFHAFLYVPGGTKKFNVIKTGSLEMITPSGRTVTLAKEKAEEAQVTVQAGEAGLWRIKLLSAKLFVEGIPAYLGTSATQMLIPAGIK
ncbi:MAG TPA: DUF4838 domain-containing protein [Chitinophagaceae bacterium]|nr:DUF4838 domain-containing protein [Chitinophagaceae bacterium]